MPLQTIFGGISALVAAIGFILHIIHDNQVDEQLDRIIRQLQDLKIELIRAVAEILEAIDGVRREVQFQFANAQISLVERALYSDAALFGDEEEALGNSFQAADFLYHEPDIVFLSSFLYVVTLRLAVLKGLRPGYYCEVPFRDEYQRYIDKANFWIGQINDAITSSHTVRVEQQCRGREENRQCHWVASHLRNGVVVDTYSTAYDGEEADQRMVVQQAEDARRRGIEQDRRDFGVVDMENTVRGWVDAFHGALRTALVREVLNRPTMAIDFNPDGMMVDGRILPVGLDWRTILLEMLSSREFRNRIQKAWDAFLNHDDDRLVQFAHRRLFNRKAAKDEITLLRRIAAHYGYGALVAVLLCSKEYEDRYGRALPAPGEPIVAAIESSE